MALGRVLVAGGHTGYDDLAAAELYDPTSNTWSSAGSMATARWAHQATPLANGKVLVSGGQDCYPCTAIASAETYGYGIAVGGIAELPEVVGGRLDSDGTSSGGMGGATYAVLAGAAAGVLAFAVLGTLAVKRWGAR